jgi:hypothetical protein
MTRRPKLPIPPEVLVTEEGWVTPPWYQYFLGQDKGWRIPVDFITTASTASNILSGRITVFASTPGVVHTLEDPEAGMETTLVCTVPSTQAGSITVRAATDVAIGPGGENALTFLTSVSTYDQVVLVGVSTSQYYIKKITAGVSVTASS